MKGKTSAVSILCVGHHGRHIGDVKVHQHSAVSIPETLIINRTIVLEH